VISHLGIPPENKISREKTTNIKKCEADAPLLFKTSQERVGFRLWDAGYTQRIWVESSFAKSIHLGGPVHFVGTQSVATKSIKSNSAALLSCHSMNSACTSAA
jgi:hypothetical protein